MISRRKLLSTSMLAGGGALALAACSTVQLQNFQAEWDKIVSQVQQDVAAAVVLAKIGLSYVPTVESVAATVAAILGPQWQAAVAAGTIVANQIAQIVQALINAATSNPPPAQARLRTALKGSSLYAPVYIGQTPQGVDVNGYRF
jgi:translation elongation factor EF-4